ncbi:MAG TPA: metallophosphoesterase [Candidatus Dormibacteraeota bacterium]|jgi:hypothetical protein|nr:metallophosphoesterase [Candidatus Dormibacteraeota bacterium]
MAATAILGDIHGDYDRMVGLVGSLDPAVHLVLVGDYFDRWPQAMEVVRWAMARPNTTALLGNHDVLVLAVLEEMAAEVRGQATESWLWNGGKVEDIERLQADPEAIDWMRGLLGMAMVGDTLIQHSDAPVYLLYGNSVEEVNRAFAARIESRDPDVLFQLFAHLCRRRQFYTPQDLEQYLGVFGARRLIHGHTPHTRGHALELFGGRIVNVDGALSRGFGPEPRGFVHWLEDEAQRTLIR